MATEVIPAPQSKTAEQILDSQQTTCCIVGGGPGGMNLALLLVRKGVPVTLLEAHKDFDRGFRADTIHPSILEILDEIGLAEPLHRLRPVKVYGPTLCEGTGVLAGDKRSRGVEAGNDVRQRGRLRISVRQAPRQAASICINAG